MDTNVLILYEKILFLYIKNDSLLGYRIKMITFLSERKLMFFINLIINYPMVKSQVVLSNFSIF